MNEWSFQWSPTFSSSSGVGYFKQNTKMLFNVMLILGHLMSTEIFNIIFNYIVINNFKTNQNLRFLSGLGFFVLFSGVFMSTNSPSVTQL